MKTSSCRIFVCIFSAVVLLVFYWGNPEGESWWLKCPLFRFTGWQCPFCGSQRAVHAFLHGCFAEAWGYNPGLWLFAPYGGLLLLGRGCRQGHECRVLRWCCRNRTVSGFLLLLAGWGIARNLWF